MKKALLLIAILAAFTIDVVAQASDTTEQIRTVFGSPKRSNGFYIGMDFGYTQVDDLDAFIGGGRIAWIANHGFAFGFAGRGFVSQSFKKVSLSNQRYYYAGGYGGLLIEPIIRPKSPIHVSFPVILGCGGISYLSYYSSSGSSSPYYHDFYNTNVFMIAEPGIELEINAVKWIRLSLGASYKFVLNVNDDEEFKGTNDTQDLLEGVSFNLGMKFGKF